jgi:hypothetical protein
MKSEYPGFALSPRKSREPQEKNVVGTKSDQRFQRHLRIWVCDFLPAYDPGKFVPNPGPYYFLDFRRRVVSAGCRESFAEDDAGKPKKRDAVWNRWSLLVPTDMKF